MNAMSTSSMLVEYHVTASVQHPLIATHPESRELGTSLLPQLFAEPSEVGA